MMVISGGRWGIVYKTNVVLSISSAFLYILTAEIVRADDGKSIHLFKY